MDSSFRPRETGPGGRAESRSRRQERAGAGPDAGMGHAAPSGAGIAHGPTGEVDSGRSDSGHYGDRTGSGIDPQQLDLEIAGHHLDQVVVADPLDAAILREAEPR